MTHTRKEIIETRYNSDKAIKRFWDKVKIGAPEECWEFQGGKVGSKGVYGGFSFQGTTIRAHRYSYMISKGKIPEEMLVCHTCDNPICVNPNHLWLGDHLSNNRDRHAKGRTKINPYLIKKEHHARGKNHGLAKLDEDKVKSILKDERTTRLIALDYGVHASAITQIKNRKTWRHVTND